MFDLNCKPELIKQGISLGWNRFAVKTVIQSKDLTKSLKSSENSYKTANESFQLSALAVKLKSPEITATSSNLKGSALIYARLHIILNDQKMPINHTDAMNSYDLISVEPTDEKLFLFACNQLDVDIITLDLSARLPFYIKQQPIQNAIKRGIMFEICFGNSLNDATARKNMLSNGTALVKAAKGCNIIISSDASSAFDLRGPLDVINLCSLFSMNPHQARSAITLNCQTCITHAFSRAKTVKGLVGKRQIEELSESQNWKVQKTVRSV